MSAGDDKKSNDHTKIMTVIMLIVVVVILLVVGVMLMIMMEIVIINIIIIITVTILVVVKVVYITISSLGIMNSVTLKVMATLFSKTCVMFLPREGATPFAHIAEAYLTSLIIAMTRVLQNICCELVLNHRFS